MNDTNKGDTKGEEEIHSLAPFPGWFDQYQESQNESQLTGYRWVPTVESLGEQCRSQTQCQQCRRGRPPTVGSSRNTPQDSQQ